MEAIPSLLLRRFSTGRRDARKDYGIVFSDDQLQCLAEVNALMDQVLAERVVEEEDVQGILDEDESHVDKEDEDEGEEDEGEGEEGDEEDNPRR
jgi:hypothetical protein